MFAYSRLLPIPNINFKKSVFLQLNFFDTNFHLPWDGLFLGMLPWDRSEKEEDL
jgi:hypothetical protein